VSRVRVPCCGWYCDPPILASPIIATCPRCGHWLHDEGQGSGPRIVGQAMIEELAAIRPEVARRLTQVTADLVDEKPCCHAAQGDA